MLKTIYFTIAASMVFFSSAGLSLFAADAQPAIKQQAQDFPPGAVKLFDSPFKTAMAADKAYMLKLDPDRLLAGFRSEAGLPEKARPYGGWETIRPGQRFTMAGHTLGHYLSALCMLAAVERDAECRRRADYIVDELAACQKATTNGMLAEFPQSQEWAAEVAAGELYARRRDRTNWLNELDNGYVPLYAMHKVMAGLRDAWLILGNRTARDTLIRQVDWLDSLLAKLPDDTLQQVLVTEHGGIMETAADVYAITGNPKYLVLAKRLNHHAFFDPLARGEDKLSGVHGNASIPKAFGAERVFELTGEKDFGAAAGFFWSTVVNRRSFVIGGHGCDEFFFATNAWEAQGLNGAGPETCNSYNMLKLSRELWKVEPDARKADFIERTLFNHILTSIDPDGGGFVYFTPMGPGAVRSFDRTGFTCCCASGMENHVKYGSFIYSHAGEKLWVDLMIPSELNWTEQGAIVRMETSFPEHGKATLTFTMEKPRRLTLNIRCPGWLKPGGMKLAVNGAAEEVTSAPDSYAVVERTWQSGDKLEIEWPMALRTEWLPQSTNWISVLWGPIVLAGDLSKFSPANQPATGARRGRAPQGIPAANVPVLEGSPEDLLVKIKPDDNGRQSFHTVALAKPSDVTLAPFYTLFHQPYAVYWRLVNRPSGAQTP